METTAQVFAKYLALSPERDGWAYSHPYNDLPDDAIRPAIFIPHTLTATSPLAASPTPGWLEVLIGHKFFGSAHAKPECIQGAIWPENEDGTPCLFEAVCGHATGGANHPTHAVARAMIAADPALRARLEKCSDWEEVNRG